MTKPFINLVVLISAVLFLGCSNNELPSGHRDGGFLLADPKEHKVAIELMKKNGIPYEIDNDGYIIYLLKDKAQVLGIKRKALYGGTLDERIKESELLKNEELKDRYESEFKQEGIPYNIVEFQGRLHIEWSQTYGPQVDVIRQRIELNIMEEVLAGLPEKN